MTTEYRRDRDLVLATVAAVQPLLDAVQRLDASLDRIRDAQRAEAERRADAIVAHLERPLRADTFQTEGYGFRSRLISQAPTDYESMIFRRKFLRRE